MIGVTAYESTSDLILKTKSRGKMVFTGLQMAAFCLASGTRANSTEKATSLCIKALFKLKKVFGKMEKWWSHWIKLQLKLNGAL